MRNILNFSLLTPTGSARFYYFALDREERKMTVFRFPMFFTVVNRDETETF